MLWFFSYIMILSEQSHQIIQSRDKTKNSDIVILKNSESEKAINTLPVWKPSGGLQVMTWWYEVQTHWCPHLGSALQLVHRRIVCSFASRTLGGTNELGQRLGHIFDSVYQNHLENTRTDDDTELLLCILGKRRAKFP